MKRVYVIENERGLIKVGVSQNVENRIKVLSKQGGFLIQNLFTTDPCSNAYEIERHVHKKLDESCVNGEWFSVSFDEAVDIVQRSFESRAQFEAKKQRCITPEDINRAFGMPY